jgi:predicted HicB family RNase H-like nuclease
MQVKRIPLEFSGEKNVALKDTVHKYLSERRNGQSFNSFVRELLKDKMIEEGYIAS